MKRFLLFKFDSYYPLGGMEDFHDDYETLEEALKAAAKLSPYRDHWHIYDCVERQIVEFK